MVFRVLLLCNGIFLWLLPDAQKNWVQLLIKINYSVALFLGPRAAIVNVKTPSERRISSTTKFGGFMYQCLIAGAETTNGRRENVHRSKH